MEITKDQNNSFTISTKQVDVSINPQSSSKAEVVLCTHGKDEYKPNPEQIVFDMPGEYEVKNTMIDAVVCDTSTAFVVTSSGIRVSFIDNEAQLSESQIEALGGSDILIIKVFGEKAEVLNKLISELEPSIVIPFGYTGDQLKQLSAEFGTKPAVFCKPYYR